MSELGADKFFQRIGNEPTGSAFNSVNAVVDMLTHTGNPLIYADPSKSVDIYTHASVPRQN
jgi:glutaminase